MAFRVALHHAGASALSRLLRFSEPVEQKRSLACCCGHQARYRELRSRRVLQGLFPADHAPDIVTTDFSPGVRRMQALVGQDVVRDRASTTYTGAIESAEQFGKRLYVEAWKRGWSRAEKKVVIGDGAEWIWNIAKDHFPGAVQIVRPLPRPPALVGVGPLAVSQRRQTAKSVDRPASETLAGQRQNRQTGLQPPFHPNPNSELARKIRNYPQVPQTARVRRLRCY